MKITYYGHSALGIEANGKNLIVDPFISANPLAADIDVNTLSADYILLTHAHYDHVWDVEKLAEKTKAKIISNHEIVSYYEAKGLKGYAMNQGGSRDFDFGSIKVVSAVHSSSFPDGANGGNPVGFVLKAADKTVYIAGDTALTMDMKLIPMFHKINLAVFPVGGNFTMDTDEALVASDFVACNRVLGVHYDTAAEIRISHDDAKAKFAHNNKELILLDINESLLV